ncbi:hypothetical protein BG003_005869 [Podila horticola]|nr:hypothetical protein BG003_005869 [Podila horticola]
MVDITLLCLLDGEATSHVFDIDINPAKSVAHLKDLIKAKKTIDFHDIDSDKLTLWRVSISSPDDDDDNFSILLENVPDKDKKKLKSSTKLSKVFEMDLPEETIHVIVQRPPPEGRPRPFSEFTLTETNRIYGDEYPKDLGRAGSTPLTSPGYIQAVSDLLETLRSAVKAMWPGKSMCPEPGYSLYVAMFLIHAVSLFPELILTQNEAISGRRGSGRLDYAIISKDDPSRMLAVTTSGLMEASGRKRRLDDDDDDSAPFLNVCTGLLECLDGVIESEIIIHENAIEIEVGVKVIPGLDVTNLRVACGIHIFVGINIGFGKCILIYIDVGHDLEIIVFAMWHLLDGQ